MYVAGSIVDKLVELARQLIGWRYAKQSSSDLLSPSRLHSAFRGSTPADTPPPPPPTINHHYHHLRHAYRAIRALHQILLRVCDCVCVCVYLRMRVYVYRLNLYPFLYFIARYIELSPFTRIRSKKPRMRHG